MVYFTNLRGVLGCGALVTYVIELSFLVSKSAHLSIQILWAFEGRPSEPKETKIQSFDQGFFGSKKSGLNTKAFSFFEQFQ